MVIGKRGFGKSYLSLVAVLLFGMLIFNVGLVSAQDQNPFVSGTVSFFKGISDTIIGVVGVISPLFNLIFGEQQIPLLGGATIFVKFVLFIVIFSVFAISLGKIPLFDDYRWALWTVSGGISIIGIRVLSSTDYITALFLPTTTVFAILSILIPVGGLFLFIEGFFGEPKYKTLRKISWVISIAVFFILYLSLFKEIDYSWVHLVSGLACILFFILDGTIQKAWHGIQTDKALSESVRDEIQTLIDKIETENERFAKGRINHAEYVKRTRELRERIAELSS